MKKQSCQSKVKHTCTGSIQYALCTSYETELPEFSELECPSIEETTEELYNLVGEIKEETDLSELGEKCLEYLLDENDKIVVKNVLLKFEEEICNLKISGSYPKTLSFLPDCEHFIVLNQESNEIVTFSIKKGADYFLMEGKPLEIQTPNCIQFFELEE